MPRFYFDVREGAELTPDQVGLEFDSLDAAQQEAIDAAAAIGQERLPKGAACAVTVELRDEHRQLLLMATVSMEIRRIDPKAQPRCA